MSELHETIDYKGYEIEVFFDDHADSPDKWGNDDCFLVATHRDFTVLREGFVPLDIYTDNKNEHPDIFNGYHVFLLYAYIHGMVSLHLSHPGCQWDTSKTGYVFVKREKGNWTRSQAFETAKGLVSTWNMWLGNEVYGVSCMFDSCWGYYGKDGMKEGVEEMKHAIDRHLQKVRKQHFRRLKNWIKYKVGLMYRLPLPE